MLNVWIFTILVAVAVTLLCSLFVAFKVCFSYGNKLKRYKLQQTILQDIALKSFDLKKNSKVYAKVFERKIEVKTAANGTEEEVKK